MTYKEAKIYIRTELSDMFSGNEIEGFILIIFGDVFNVSSINFALNPGTDLPVTGYKKIQNIVARLKTFEPIQYILSQTEFYGIRFKLNPNVLIPRQETEELVDLIIKENKASPGLSVLDIGTGSGCIAIALAKNLTNSKVAAIDICLNAIEVAKINSRENNLNITFIQADILKTIPELTNKTFDIIVSNPPYVTHSEKNFMAKNVLEYEPELALFVDDFYPLIFYEAIVKFAENRLNEEGRLYFEINERFGEEIRTLMGSYNFDRIEILKDLDGKDRIATAKKRIEKFSAL